MKKPIWLSLLCQRSKIVLAWTCALGLGACSMLGVAYEQSPWLIERWVNNQVKLDDPQANALHADLKAELGWHRRERLPAWVSTARAIADDAPRDWSAQEVCARAEFVRQELADLLMHSTVVWARLGLQLRTPQLQALAQQRQRARQDFADDFVTAPPEDALTLRTRRAVSNWERLYGDLSDAQVAALREHLRRSPWSAAQSLQRQQQRDTALMALLQDLRDLSAQGDSDDALREANARMRQWLTTLWTPQDARQADDGAGFWQHQCAMVADMHQRMSAEQRAQLARTLREYAQDFEDIAAAS